MELFRRDEEAEKKHMEERSKLGEQRRREREKRRKMW